jgi:hypothetical protein
MGRKFVHSRLDSLANKNDSIIVFDCEFWHVLGDDDYKYPKGHDYFFLPRQIGGFILKRSSNGWLYKQSFFVTFSQPKMDSTLPVTNLRVTSKTSKKLEHLIDEIGFPIGNTFPSELSDDEKDIFDDILHTYKTDTLIARHHKTKSWYTQFLKKFKESTVIVKGKEDIEALQNACKYYNITYSPPSHVVDIAYFNKKSIKTCGSAKLKDTFDCLKPSFDKETVEIAKHLVVEKAHDPVSDAHMTFLIALQISRHFHSK